MEVFQNSVLPTKSRQLKWSGFGGFLEADWLVAKILCGGELGSGVPGLVENNWSASNLTFEIYRKVLDAKKLLHFLYSTIKVTVDARNV